MTDKYKNLSTKELSILQNEIASVISDKKREEAAAKKKMEEESLHKHFSKSSLKVLELADEELCCFKDRQVLKEGFNLGPEECDKPYYILSYWESGSSGSFADEKELKEALREKLLANYDDSFSINIYDIKKEKEVVLTNIDITYILK